MIDIKWIVENPEAFDKAMERRFCDVKAEKLIELDKKKRELITIIQDLQSKRNSISKEVGIKKSKGENTDELMKESTKIGMELEALEAKLDDKENDELYQTLIRLPNILQDDVPFGKDDNDNQEIEKWGTQTKFDFKPKEHFDLGLDLGMMDFDQAAKICGARSTGLFGKLALLERALSNFFLDFVEKYGYIEVSLPSFVKENAMFGTSNLPKFAEDAYVTTNGMWLIPTSEVTMTNLVAEKLVSEDELPFRFTAFTPCYRSEAGSAGKDTRGMLRQHHFKKVEMVSITTQEKSKEEHERMSEIEGKILQALNLPYRTMKLSSGDTGFGSSKTYDHEVWLPGQGKYREISSCSNCWDFQARRMNARYKAKDGKNKFVHTLNGSALAIGRTIIAIMENYQQKDGSILIPEVLVPYMNGLTVISK